MNYPPFTIRSDLLELISFPANYKDYVASLLPLDEEIDLRALTGRQRIALHEYLYHNRDELLKNEEDIELLCKNMRRHYEEGYSHNDIFSYEFLDIYQSKMRDYYKKERSILEFFSNNS
jgi:hypothetical protein